MVADQPPPEVRTWGGRYWSASWEPIMPAWPPPPPPEDWVEPLCPLAWVGGSTGGGLLGEYFPTPDLSGPPAFSRRDVRVDFDWSSGRPPGGSISPGFRDVGAGGAAWSARWSGVLIPRSSGPHVFYATGLAVRVKPAGADDWMPIGPDPIDLEAGVRWEVEAEHRSSWGVPHARLWWAGPGQAAQPIEPIGVAGANAETYRSYTFADALAMTGHRWMGSDPDADLWPKGDVELKIWQGGDGPEWAGTYLLQFRGMAAVIPRFVGRFRVGDGPWSATLPAGSGYDPATNTTTATFEHPGGSIFYLIFRDTRRAPDAPAKSGVTDIQFMRPTAPGADTPSALGTVIDPRIRDAYAPFVALRWLSANFNVTEREWADRLWPTQPYAFAGSTGHVCWERLVMLANEAGKDLAITVPIRASADYVTRLARLLRYGSDGDEPFEADRPDPAYPPLNSNLRVYVEWSNEIWNWGFSQAPAGVADAKAAVAAGTPEGKALNFDGKAPGGDFRRWHALNTVKASDAFRSVFGDAAMGDRVRILLEYQYDDAQGTATHSLGFLDRYFHKADPGSPVTDPHPVSYFIWGAGGANYYGWNNPDGRQSTIVVPGGDFEDPSAWTMTGDAGTYVAGARAGAPAPRGTQAAFVGRGGRLSVPVTFPAPGVYAVALLAACDPADGDALRIWLGDRECTPRNRTDYRPQAAPSRLGYGVFGLNRREWTEYGMAPVAVEAPGEVLLRVEGHGVAGRYTHLDGVTIRSLEALWAAGVPEPDYAQRQVAQARHARQWSLRLVAYEGGWGLGGDIGGYPIQNHAKFVDPRAVDAAVAHLDAFTAAGGALSFVGTYSIWPWWETARAAEFPLMRGVARRAEESGPVPPPPPPPTTARYLAEDRATRGDWPGRYGALGIALAGDGSWLPGGWTVAVGIPPHIWSATTTDPRAPWRVDRSSRLAACWSGGPIEVAVRPPDRTPYRLTAHLLDWSNAGRVTAVEARAGSVGAVFDVPNAGAVLDVREARSFRDGLYLTWEAVGPVVLRLVARVGGNAVLSGLFLDPIPGPSA